MRRRITALAVTLVLLGAALTAIAAGTPDNPVITLSYLTEIFAPMLLGEAETRANASLDAVNEALGQALSDVSTGLNKGTAQKTASDQKLIDAVNGKAAQAVISTGGVFRLISAGTDKTLNLKRGSSVMLVSGAAVLSQYPAVNMTTGADLTAASPLEHNHTIVFPDGAGKVTFSEAAQILVLGEYTLSTEAYIPEYGDLAVALKSMGLLRGTGNGFALAREATRTEAMYMMLYLLGEIGEAEIYTGDCPFTDVPAWARNVVAYAYSKGYTKGISETLFGSYNVSTPDQYTTMLLRVMGYDDSSGDFSWDQALDFSVTAGVLTESERDALRRLFYRDQLVYVSYYALYAPVKGGTSTLEQLLISRLIFTQETADLARSKVTRQRGMG